MITIIFILCLIALAVVNFELLAGVWRLCVWIGRKLRDWRGQL